MKHDLLADVFSTVKNSEAIGRKECSTPASKVIRGVLKVMQKHGYIGEFEYIDDRRGGNFRVRLLGRINDCNVIKPRFSVTVDEFIKWEKNFLPAEKIGVLIVTTSRGIMDQKEAMKQNTGGKLLGFVY